MTIKKFIGNTREEAIKNARDELGSYVVIMNIKEVKKDGILGFFKKKTYEATAAIDTDETESNDSVRKTIFEEGNNFDAVAGEEPVINKAFNKEQNIQGENKINGQGNLNESLNSNGLSNLNSAINSNVSINSKSVSNFDDVSDSSKSPLKATDLYGKKDVVKNKIGENLSKNSMNSDEDFLAGESLKNAFKAVNEVINKENKKKKSQNNNAEYDMQENVQSGINSGIKNNGIDNLKSDSRNIVNKKDKNNEYEGGFVPLNNSGFSNIEKAYEDAEKKGKKPENARFVNMLYNTLLSNEVDEKYVNQIVKDMEKVIQGGNKLDYLLANVYQKMVLMMGKPEPIVCIDKKPVVVFLVGPTGVGKTTTIAKLASKYKFDYGKSVGFITTDTYRIAATDQLKVYADIMDIPLDVVITKDDINKAIAAMNDKDLIIVDTAGFSHKDKKHRTDMASIISTVDKRYKKNVYLVLTATTKYRDIKNIIDTYKSFTDFNIIFTKLDETDAYGNILSAKLYSNTNLSYVCTGQDVPDDIEVIDIQKIVKQLLGGK